MTDIVVLGSTDMDPVTGDESGIASADPRYAP